MNYSEVFSEAHKQAKAMMKTGLFASYRGAFSVALSSVLRAEWALFKAEKEAKKVESVKTIKQPASMPAQKRAASGRGFGRGFGRRVAKVRRLGFDAMIEESICNQSTIH